MDYVISYYSEAVEVEILDLPDTLAARYLMLARRMVVIGPNLGEPHTKAMGGGLFRPHTQAGIGSGAGSTEGDQK